MKAEILKMLREADGYISGQEICEKFNVSRKLSGLGEDAEEEVKNS